MKKQARAYISFTRSERAGMLVLSSIIVLLIAVRATMNLWVNPNTDKAQEEKLTREWNIYKNNHTPVKRTAVKPDIPKFVYVNSADSATLEQLPGIGPVTAAKIIYRRQHTGPFTDHDQLKEVGSFTDTVFHYLKKHVLLDTLGK